MRVREFLSCGHTPTLVSAFLYFDVSFMVWVLIGALGVFLAQEFQLSATHQGFLVAVPILAGSLFRIPMGIATDRFGPKWTGAVGLSLTVLPLLWGWQGARRLEELFAVGILLGVAGASFAVALPLASRWYPPRHQGLAMGIAGAGNSGTVLAALFAPRLAEAFGWHSVFGLAILPVLVTHGLYALLAKESPNQRTPMRLAHYFAVLGVADTWWFNLLFLAMSGLGMGNGAIFQLVPQRFRREIGVATGIVGAAGGVGGFLLPSLIGLLKDLTGSYGNGFLLVSLGGFGCVVLLTYVRRSWRQTWARPDLEAVV